MLKQILEYHSGRGIAMCRLALAVVFLIVLLVEPSQPVRYSEAAYALLGGYVIISCAVVAATWNNWWLDYQLRFPVILCDGAIYLLAMYFTTDRASDFTSPFLSSFIFIILSATVRWGRTGMFRAALALSSLYLAVAFALEFAGIDFDLNRFGRRGVYMVLLSLVLVWFGLQRGVRSVERLDFASEEQEEVPIAEIARYAMKATGSPAAVGGWWSNEDPHVLAYRVGPGEELIRHLAPEVLGLPQEQTAALFDRDRSRLLAAGGNGTVTASRRPFKAPLAEYFGVRDGLAIPIASSSGKGLLIVTGNPAINIDHLGLAPWLAQEIAAALDRRALSRIAREAALSQFRNTLARDLHDSVAQTLAGVRFRLESIRAQIRAGADPAGDFDELKASLTGEQKHLRLIIERLRRTQPEPRQAPLASQLQAVCAELERTWDAKLNLTSDPDDLTVPFELAYEIMQIAREAVANGVRHGGARNFDIAVGLTLSGIDLDIRDDGTGFTGDPPPRPRTLVERARALGGQLTVFNSRPGAHLLINLPHRIQP